MYDFLVNNLELLKTFVSFVFGISSVIVGIFLLFYFKRWITWFILRYWHLSIASVVILFLWNLIIQYIVFFIYSINGAIAVSFSPIIAYPTMVAISSMLFVIFIVITLKLFSPLFISTTKTNG